MSIEEKRMLILASSSPRRQELIRAFQLPTRIEVSHVEEDYDPGATPAVIVETLALRKASAIALKLKDQSIDGIVIGSDTIVVYESQILNKPVDEDDAKRMLSMLQGQTHQVFSGVACLDLRSGKQSIQHRMTEVTMRKLSTDQISRYIASGESSDKAGAYGIQGLGATLVASVHGCYFNVVGLPLSLLSEMLKELGVDVI